MNQETINASEWQNPDNWTGPKWLSVYFNKRDSRVWVPKQMPGLGRTINLGRPGGVAWLFAVILGLPLLVTGVCVLATPQSRSDDLVGWYHLPNRHHDTRAVLPGPGKLIPVLKRAGIYYSVCRGMEIPLKECPEGLEWGPTQSSMKGTKIGVDAGSKAPYIIIVDSGSQNEGAPSDEKRFMTKIAEPPGLLNPKANPPQALNDFIGCYQPLYFPYFQWILTREGDKYQVKGRRADKDEWTEWAAEGKELTPLEPLPDKAGFVLGRKRELRLVFNRDLKRYEILMGRGTNQLTMPLVRISPSLPPGTEATPPIGIPSWH